MLDRDPHADAIVWPGPSVASISEPIDLGPFEDAMAGQSAACCAGMRFSAELPDRARAVV